MDVSGIRCAPDATLDIGELSQYGVKPLKTGWLACRRIMADRHRTVAFEGDGCRRPGTPPLPLMAEIENVRSRMAGYGPINA